VPNVAAGSYLSRLGLNGFKTATYPIGFARIPKLVAIHLIVSKAILPGIDF
jgi:hypothetical protein